MKNAIEKSRRHAAATGATCFLAGIIAALLGSLLTVMAWFAAGEIQPWLHGGGTALLVIAVPLILIAGCFLDWAERGPKTPTVEDSRKGQPAVSSRPRLIVAVLIGFGFLLASNAHAQQTIFNVPTTDVLDRGKVYVELDASLKPTDGVLVSKFSSFVPRVVVGAGNRIEIGLNITGNVQPGIDSTTMVPTIKWKPYQGQDNGWAFVAGDNVFVPVRHRAYRAGNYVYTEASKSFKNGTRVTFGGYDFTRSVVARGNRAGGQFGFEQPLNKEFTFAADWLTGKHAAGYFTPGIVFKAGPKVTGYAGYSIGNQNLAQGNNFFLLELGYNFN